jgi:hypothetical protein
LPKSSTGSVSTSSPLFNWSFSLLIRSCRRTPCRSRSRNLRAPLLGQSSGVDSEAPGGAISGHCSGSNLLILATQDVFPRYARRHARLGSCNLSGGHRKRKHHLKLASFSNHAAHFDAAMMLFSNTRGGCHIG